MNNTLRCYLASSSPARYDLLKQFKGWTINVLPADIDESTEEQEQGEVSVVRLAQKKGRKVLSLVNVNDAKNIYIVAADTLVCCENQVMGKPLLADDARSMLSHLSGKKHHVHTGLWLYNIAKSEEFCQCVTTEIDFAALTTQEIEHYIATDEWVGAAGAYRIQGSASAFITNIQGSYTNVIGLPLETLFNQLKHWGIALLAPQINTFSSQQGKNI